MGLLIALPTSEQYSFKRYLTDTPLPIQTRPDPGVGEQVWESHGLAGKHSQERMSTQMLTTDPDRDESNRMAESSSPEPAHQEQHVLDQETLRRHMLAHSLKGHKMSVIRTPFVGEITTIVSPVNPDVQFGIKRVGNREVMAHRDKNASIRYIQREGSDEYISEKDYPVGTLRVDTVALVLENWNLGDPQGNPLRIDKESILSHLEPEELDFLYDKALEINPILAGGPARKNDSSAS